MGITNFGLETPEYWNTWSALPVVALRRKNCLSLERCWSLEHSCYEYTTLVRIYFTFLLLHFRDLRWPMFGSDRTNACAFNGLYQGQCATGFQVSLKEMGYLLFFAYLCNPLQYFTHADAATNYRTHLVGGRPLFLDCADGKLRNQSSRGIQAIAGVPQANRCKQIGSNLSCKAVLV